jgi:hypothetical protein
MLAPAKMQTTWMPNIIQTYIITKDNRWLRKMKFGDEMDERRWNAIRSDATDRVQAQQICKIDMPVPHVPSIDLNLHVFEACWKLSCATLLMLKEVHIEDLPKLQLPRRNIGSLLHHPFLLKQSLSPQ